MTTVLVGRGGGGGAFSKAALLKHADAAALAKLGASWRPASLLSLLLRSLAYGGWHALSAAARVPLGRLLAYALWVGRPVATLLRVAWHVGLHAVGWLSAPVEGHVMRGVATRARRRLGLTLKRWHVATGELADGAARR
eukprot:364891-Chlamydomonas_euryale.AAC.9